MIPEISALYTDQILHEAARRYGARPEEVRSLGGFESFVYEFTKNGVDYVLKITHTIRRSVNYIRGEIEWVNFLDDQGIKGSRVVPSEQGLLIEEIEAEEGAFLAIAYVKARGSAITAEVWDEPLFEQWGAMLGRMHRHTKAYEVSSPLIKRQAWDEEEQLRADKYLPADDPVIAIVEERLNHLRSLPVTRDTYGLLHTDLHQKNFFLENGDIYPFDFDDCGYTYFVNDIGITLYYAMRYAPRKYDDVTTYARRFFRTFMKGYLRENTITALEIAYIQDFIKLRHLLLYIVFNQVGILSRETEEQQQKLLQHQREVISEEPLVPLDFVAEFRSMQV
ncbi:phosphotransferase enzyme family protein [Paenibacillus guangzhouensis]|uniref:phosphotransferase enzyme family protein n=1 Tax=Paenibacillus guangzhouensis TaxID=1473112 RepID=UPI0012669266|nr:phosphotransferase [Paenibacillus guangzhouensis]